MGVTIQKPGRVISGPGVRKISGFRILICQYSLVLSPTMLVNDPLAGLFIDFVPLTAGLGHIFRGRLVAVAQENHRLIVRIRSFVILVGRNAYNLPG